ncbi:HugZ family protein [Novipirellula caenicola]|uniref:CREG-like beta-barrel domain-containing protein n=1 Tax=Novipirellula caenicola TaxID=1536901 RepID=A0ABP9VPM6_9BACT
MTKVANANTVVVITENALTASFGTLNEDNSPFVSLVTIASQSPTSVLMLLSGLAQHTKNLSHSVRCSLMVVEECDQTIAPLAGARVSLCGSCVRIAKDEEEVAREIFLGKHPHATVYADFDDFTFYRFDIDEAHLITGFGRIETITADELRNR